VNETAKAIGRWSAQLLVCIFAGAATLVVIAALVFSLVYPEEKLKGLVLDLVNENLQGEVTVGPVFISPLTGVVARDLVVLSGEEFDRAPAVLLDEFVLRYDLGELLGENRISIDVAEALGMEVYLIEIPGLGWNVEHLVIPSEEEEEPFTWDSLPVDVRLRRFVVRDLSLAVSDGISASLGGVRVVLKGLDTANPGPVDVRVQKDPGPVSVRLGPAEAPQAAGRIEELALNLNLSVAEDPLTAKVVSGDFYLAASGIELSSPLGFAPAGGLTLRGSFNADLDEERFSLTGGQLSLGDYLSVGMDLAASVGDEPRAVMDLRIENADLSPLARDLSPLLPELYASGSVSGAVDLDVRLSETLEPEEALVGAELSLIGVNAGMQLPMGPARVAGLDGRVTLGTAVELADPKPLVNLSTRLTLSSAEGGPYSVGNLRLAADGAVDLANLSTRGLKLDLKAGRLSSLVEPGPLLASDVAVEGVFSADLGGGSFAVEGLQSSLKAAQFSGAGIPGPLSVHDVFLGGSLTAEPEGGNFTLDGARLDLGDALHWRGSAKVRDFARGGASIDIDGLEVDLDRTLKLIPPGVFELPPVTPVGKVSVQGRVEVASGALENPDPAALVRSLRTDIAVELADVSVGIPQGGADGLNGLLTLDLDSGTGDFELDAAVDRVVLADLPVPVEGIVLKLKGRLERTEVLLLETLDAGVDSLDFDLTGNGAVSDLTETPIVALDLQGRLGRIGRPLKAGEGIADLEGQVGFELNLRGPVLGPKPMQVTGRVRLHQVNFKQGGVFAVNGVEGELPIDSKVVLGKPLPLPGGVETAESPFGERRYELLAPFTPPPNLTVEEILVTAGGMRDIRVDDLEFTWAVSGGGLHVWRLTMKALGGSLLGKLNLLLTDEVPAFNLQLEFSDVNVGYLIEGVEPTEGAEINGDLRLSGRGSDLGDLIRRFDVEGSVNITRIGKEVLDKMLLFLDPEGTNPSITQVRGLLGRIQKKPDLVTMDIKNQRMTMKIRIVDTGFSLLALFTSFIDLSEFTIPRIPIAEILKRYLLPELEKETGSVLG
jgi:hypothetical protein